MFLLDLGPQDLLLRFRVPTQFLDKRIKFIFGMDKWIKLKGSGTLLVRLYNDAAWDTCN